MAIPSVETLGYSQIVPPRLGLDRFAQISDLGRLCLALFSLELIFDLAQRLTGVSIAFLIHVDLEIGE